MKHFRGKKDNMVFVEFSHTDTVFFCLLFAFRRGNLRPLTTEKMKIASSSSAAAETPISINDIEDLLANIPTTTRRAKPTTTTTTVRPKPTTPAASDNDDLNFLRQVVRGKPSRRKKQYFF